ncbi:MAG TPA: sulfite exporter TauE/SafE family protein [Anaerolineae bacterium]|nr:sulfite exporter TauE/SafE family protein [Anaerolineae bacterium]
MMTDIFLPIGAGLVIGVLIGLTGMGGGALMTPFLITVMGLNTVLAVGTDLVFATITKLFGSIEHRREKNVSIRNVLWMACGSLPAANLSARYLIGQIENTELIEVTLPRLLGGVLLLVGGIILVRNVLGERPPDDIEVEMPRPMGLIVIGAIGGTLVGLTSIGGGTVIMALLILFYSLPVQYMVGLDVVHGALLAGTTAVTYAYNGQTNWGLVGLLLIGSLPGVWFGAWSVSHVNQTYVRYILSGIILLTGLNMFWGGGH